MKKVGSLLIASALIAFLVGCSSSPPARTVPQSQAEPVPEVPPAEVVKPVEKAADTETFDPSTVSQQEYDSTKSDVQVLIERLNAIIQQRDYDTWTSYLTEEYKSRMSDPQYLATQSESKVLQKFNIKLRTLKDYFFYVVVPSRKTEQVDEITFIGPHRVRAYMFSPKGEKLLLYDLEKINDMWKIGVGR